MSVFAHKEQRAPKAVTTVERVVPAGPLQPLAFSPAQAAMLLGISQRGIYNLIERGEIPTFRIGVRRLVLRTECERYLERKVQEAAA